ncbi:unnamed protein product [Durusdinium trenchii]|uniref:Major facilitator superfamily (MFS) profile domain-containing protein n=1 Tax=Durusdinium trenchii TaxID=1381693 RepID=A0ABP0N0F4_9DINO
MSMIRRVFQRASACFVTLCDSSFIQGSVTRSAAGHKWHLPLVTDEWALEAWQRGAIVSVVFIGILLGNTIGGPLGDSTGRKIPVLLSFLGIVLFSVLSASCTGFWSLAVVRTFVGASFGLGQPATMSLMKDITPSRWQLFIFALVIGVPFPCGEIYSASLIWYNDPSMKELDWRWLCIMGAVPSIFGFVLSYSFMKESPAYLLENGYVDEAKELLESYKRWNGAEHVCCDLVTTSAHGRTPRSARQNVEAIFSPALRWTALAMIYSCFMLNVSFYGSLYAFPQVFSDMSASTPYSPAMALVVGAIYEIPGPMAGPLVATVLEPKTLLRVCPLALALACVIFLIGASGQSMIYSVVLQTGYAGIKVIANGYFAVAYSAASGVFPAVVRTTGSAACVAGGRVGGILSPLIFEQLMIMFNGWGAFFVFMIVGNLLNCIILCALDLEDVDDIDSLEELKPMLGSGETAA